MKNLTRCCSILLLILTLSSPAAAQREAEPGFAIATLDEALERGQIDEATRGLRLLQLLHAPEQLPRELQRPLEPNLPCLTPLVIEAIRALAKAPPALREQGRRLLGTPPPVTVGFLDSETFPLRVYYQERGDQTLAANVLTMAELGFEQHTVVRDWTAPWGLDEEENPIARLDIYLVDTAAGYSGFCEPLENNDDTSWTDTLTRCQIDRDNDAELLEATVVHEMDHAFQFTEDALEMVGGFEMFCVHSTHNMVTTDLYWMYFIPAFQQEPHRSIHIPSMSNQLYHYGSGLFAQFLDERYGEGDATLAPHLWQAARQDGTVTVTDMWVESATPNEPDLFDAIDAFLREHHEASFDEALVEFAEWRLLLGDNDDGEHFADGAEWRGAEVEMSVIYDASELPVYDEVASQLTSPTGTSYLRVETDSLGGVERLGLELDLDVTSRWAVQIFRLHGHLPAEVIRAEVVDSRVDVTVEAAGAVAVVIAITDLGDEDFDGDDYPTPTHDYAYSLELISTPSITAIEPSAVTAGVSGVEVTVRASPLSPEATLSLGDGVTVSEVRVEDEQLIATVDVELSAAVGQRDVTVINPGSDPGLLEGGFEVLAPPAPTLDSVDPDELEPGSDRALTVEGAGLLEGATADLGEGIVIQLATVTDQASMLLVVNVDPAAEAGPRTLTVTNPGGASATLEAAVVVLPSGADGGPDGGSDGGPDGGPDGPDDESACGCRAAGNARDLAGQALPLLIVGLLLLGLRRREPTAPNA